MRSGWGGHYLKSQLLLLVKSIYKIGCLCEFGRKCDKNLQLWGQDFVDKRKLICDVDNIASYAVVHDSANILGRGSSSTSIVERVYFVGNEAKGNACWYFKTIKEGSDLAFNARVVVWGIAVEVVELRDVPL